VNTDVNIINKIITSQTQHIQMIKHYDQAMFKTVIQMCFNIWKLKNAFPGDDRREGGREKSGGLQFCD
jgi:hypothetical protein